MARSHTSKLHNCCRLRPSSTNPLDFSFRTTPWYFFRPGTSVHFSAVDVSSQTIRNSSSQHHSLSPFGKWIGRTFHCHLKSALHANWTNEQPWVLLGIRTTPKEELGCSSAEIVYGAPLSVSGESGLGTNKKIWPKLQQLHEQISSLKPIPTSWHGSTRSHTPEKLQAAKFVFICWDDHHTPLQRLYETPIKLLEPRATTFKVDRGGRSHTVSVDRLKLANIDPKTEQPLPITKPRQQSPQRHLTTQASSPSSQPTITHSNRQIRPTKRYISVLEWSGVAESAPQDC